MTKIGDCFGLLLSCSGVSATAHSLCWQTKKYRYLSETMGLDIDGMLADLKAAPEGSTFILHTVAHNPTGVDPNKEQWRQIAEVCKERKAILVFDTAYQGYARCNLPPKFFLWFCCLARG